MALAADHAIRLDRLDAELRRARAPKPELFSKLVASAGVRLALLDKSGPAARIERLIEAGAWTEAALALIELEMPGWKLRRLVCENGEWVCSLSRRPQLPPALDDAAEASHEVLPLAILTAFVEARRRSGTAPQSTSAAPHLRPAAERMICCDNFS